MAVDSELLRKNCKEFSNSYGKAIDVLRNANGKKHYTDIAKLLDIPETRVSGLLKKALKLGLAEKINNGYYKKEAGILGYMPKSKGRIKSQKYVKDLLTKITKKKTKQGKGNQLIVSGKIYTTIEKMSEAYTHLYVVENTLRDLIRKVLSNEVDWWKNKIPPGIQKEVEETIKRTPYHAAKRKDELEYTHLGQLKEIIICKNNWKNRKACKQCH